MAAAISAFLPVAMMVLMLSLGLRLRGADLAATLRQPRALAAGLAVQMLALPVLAWLIGTALRLEPAVFAGLMLVAASPGGVSSNYITHLARGAVALSVAMTLVTSLAAPLSLPVVLAASGIAPPAPALLARISLAMTAVGIAPLLAGMALTRFAPGVSGWLAPRLAPLAKGLFALMVLATFVQNWGAMRAAAGAAGLAVLVLATAAPLLGLGVARLLALGPVAGRTIAIEASLQNVALTIFVAGPVMGRPELALPGLIYALAMNLCALILVGLSGRSPALARHDFCQGDR